MSASKQCKNAGFSGLQEVSCLSGEHRTTLARWYKEKPNRFKAILYYCAVIKVNES